jgi:hypothetical protein
MVPGAGPVISTVTFASWLNAWANPAQEVELTCAASSITTAQGPENRNAAFLAGIHLKFPEGHGNPTSGGERFRGLFGDTLVVVMDLSEVQPDSVLAKRCPDLWTGPVDDVIVQTAECLRLNARRRWPRVKHLALSVDGSEGHTHLEGVHPLEEVALPTAPWQKSEGTLQK